MNHPRDRPAVARGGPRGAPSAAARRSAIEQRARRTLMPRVIHFEIPADDPDRVIAFYEKVFGWKTQKWEGPEPYWLLTTGEDSQAGINGGVMRKHHPAQPVANTIDVPNVDE